MLGALAAGGIATAAAHEIPAHVTILGFVRPEAQRLQLLLRVPLGVMRDYDFPLRDGTSLDITAADSLIREGAMLWLADAIDVFEDDRRLGPERLVAMRVSLPSDRSFTSWDSASAGIRRAPLPPETDIPWAQAPVDVLFEYDIESATSRFAIEPRLARLGVRTQTLLRFVPAAGAERAFQFAGDPGLVRLDPGWGHAVLRFVRLGFEHILAGWDHLLFVVCLVIPVRRWRALVAIVTAFTVAHSITLMASALGLAPDALWFPPLVETVIALSIVYMAFENIVGAKLAHRWKFAFAFGLVHGFGFSFALRESMQFAGGHVISALFAFNIGVELGQLLVVAVAAPVLAVLFRRVVAERVGTILLSALVAHSAWHWMTDRGAALRDYQFQWPAFDLALAAAAMRWAMLAFIAAGAAWLMWRLARWAGRITGNTENTENTDFTVKTGDFSVNRGR
jgi:hypothetical protein